MPFLAALVPIIAAAGSAVGTGAAAAGSTLAGLAGTVGSALGAGAAGAAAPAAAGAAGAAVPAAAGAAGAAIPAAAGAAGATGLGAAGGAGAGASLLSTAAPAAAATSAAPPLLAAAGPELGAALPSTALPSAISTPLAAGPAPLLSAATPGAEAINAGAIGATGPVSAGTTDAPMLAGMPSGPVGTGSVSTVGTGTGTTTPGSSSYLQQANTFLRENEPVLNLVKGGTQMMTQRQPGQRAPGFTRTQLQAVTPPPQMDRLAFLRAFGMQG